MISVVRSAGATLANAALPLVVLNDQGILTDPYAAAFQIFDASGTQVQAKTLLDVTVSGANRLGTGRFAAVWVPSGGQAFGQYVIRWFYTMLSGGLEMSFDKEFELVSAPYSFTNPYYCTIYDLRAEGFSDPTTYPDALMQKWIGKASRYVEHYTGRTFSPKYKTVSLDGNGSRAALSDEPVIGVETVAITFATAFGANSPVVPTDTLRVYNRHLTQNLTSPDDRDSPKLEFVHGADLAGVNFNDNLNSGYRLSQLIFPRGRQNVQVAGVFGYTEYDGSFTGKTPEMIRECTKLMAVRLRAQLIDAAARAQYMQGSRIIEEHTRDQGYQMSALAMKGEFTGDWEIDQILAAFMRPPRFGAA